VVSPTVQTDAPSDTASATSDDTNAESAPVTQVESPTSTVVVARTFSTTIDPVLTLAVDVSEPAATLVQTGDNELDFGASQSLDSGDAVAGGQVIGATGSAGGSIEITDTSVDTRARTGDTDADVDLTSTAGPIVSATSSPLFFSESASTSISIP
jgi:hypothetical protein